MLTGRSSSVDKKAAASVPTPHRTVKEACASVACFVPDQREERW